MEKLKKKNFFINKSFNENTNDFGLLNKIFNKTVDNMLYNSAFDELIRNRENEEIDFYLNQDQDNFFNFADVFTYFDTDKLSEEKEAEYDEDLGDEGRLADIVNEVFNEETEEDTVTSSEFQKIKKDLFHDIVNDNLIDVLQDILDDKVALTKVMAKEHSKKLVPNYNERQLDFIRMNYGKDTHELVKIFKRRQSQCII